MTGSISTELNTAMGPSERLAKPLCVPSLTTSCDMQGSVGFIRVVATEENVFVIASAYIIAEGLAKEMDVQNVVPPLRDAVMWAVMQFSGFTYKSFRETVEYVFGSAWTITLNSQMLKAASDAMITQGVPWPKSRRSRMRRAAKSRKEELLSESHVACVRL